MDDRERISRAVRADDRAVSPLRAAARLSHGTASVLARRPAGPAGLAQAGVDGPGPARERSRAARLDRQGQRIQRNRQGPAARHRARAAGAGASRVSRRERARPGRALDLAVLPSDPAAAVRLGRASGGSSRTRRVRASASCVLDDARLQIDRAIALHEATFGSRPPGAVAVGRFGVGRRRGAGRATPASAGSRPTRTSWRGRLGVPVGGRPDLLYRPYRIGESGPVVLFRDHAMSDRIGFQYQSWEPLAAAADFIAQVRDAGRRYLRGHRRGSGDCFRDPGRRERLGVLRRWRAPVPAGALSRPGRGGRHRDGHHGRGGRGSRHAVAVDVSGLLDQR